MWILHLCTLIVHGPKPIINLGIVHTHIHTEVQVV